MAFYTALLNGCTIRIEDNRKVDYPYYPAEFWMRNGQLFTWSDITGVFQHNLTKETLANHFIAMLEEGLDIIIKH